MASQPNLCNLTEHSLARLINMREVFNFIGVATDGEIHRHTLDTDNLSSTKREEAQLIKEVMQRAYKIYLKHGFQQSQYISDERWRSYIAFLYAGQDPNMLLNDDLVLYLIWKGKEPELDKLLSATRKKALYYRILNVHGKTENELKELISTTNFTDLIYEEIRKTRVETPSPEIAKLSDTICDRNSGCDACIKNGVTFGSYINQELSNLV